MTTAKTAGLAAVLWSASGCGVLLDSAYLMSDGRYTESVPERRATGESQTQVEYDVGREPDGTLRLSCVERTRPIERAWAVEKTFQYRGGYHASMYQGTAVLSGLIAAVVAGSLGAACAQDDLDVSCWNMVYAAPFALDLGWSIYRAYSVPPPKLVHRETSGETLAFAQTASVSTPVACEASVASLVIGTTNGPSATDVLNGLDEGRILVLSDGALPIALASAGVVLLEPNSEAVRAWGANQWMSLWVIDREGRPHSVNADRCAVLGPMRQAFSGSTSVAFERACPLPAAPVR